MYNFNQFLSSILIFTVLSLNAQEDKFIVPDSLVNVTFDYLSSKYYDGEPSLKNDSIIGNTFLLKAIKAKDTLKMATAYCFLLSSTDDFNKKEKYLDVAIELTRHNPSLRYPSLLYSFKAGIYDDKKDFKTALDYYILSHDSALEIGNLNIVNMMRYNIGVTKLNIGMYKEALAYAIDSWNDLKNEPVSEEYLNSLFLISSAFANNSKLDSASIFNHIGILKSMELKSAKHLARFKLLEGVNKYKKFEYEVCIDSIKKSLPQLIIDMDTENVAIAYYFIGKAYSNLDKPQVSIYYFNKMDSIFSNTDILVPYCREGYRGIIEYYKSKNDLENQLLYTSKLVKIDSILDSNYQYLISNIYEKHEKPRLVAKKQKLIDALEKEKSSFGKYLIFLIIVIMVVGSGYILSIRKRKNDFKKFTKIIADLDKKLIDNTIDDSKTKDKVKNILDIDKDIINNVLLKLNKFEKEGGYLNQKITLQILSKKMGTNAKYLSKIINTHKEKNFSNYLNDLRVEYAINRLHVDKQFRKYSIDSIANESGFKSRRSFFGVFQKKTGISPSYFINKLETD